MMFEQLKMNPVVAEVVTSTAEISDCGTYRYRLTREWDDKKPHCAWVMLNPSTADALADDPTIRRCMGFARAWGYGGIHVRNLFALRSAYPGVLLTHPDPIGPHGNECIFELASAPCIACIVIGWGAIHRNFHQRATFVAKELAYRGASPMCIGLTNDGQPRHPLYMPKSSKPLPIAKWPAHKRVNKC